MKVFLTGATGFVGRNFLLRLLTETSVSRIACSVRNGGKLAGQLAAEGLGRIPGKIEVLDGDHTGWGFDHPPFAPDVCIHLAGVLFARSKEDYFAGNLGGAQKLVGELPPECPLIVVSSQSALGPTPPGIDALDETASPAPLSFYGKSKLAMEQFLRSLGGVRRIFILRPPIILGPRDTATEPLFQMARGPFLFKPCKQDKTLSWIAVEDFVEALFMLARRVVNDHTMPGGLWHVANPTPISDSQLLREAANVVGGSGRLVRLPESALHLAAAASRILPAIGRAVPSLTPDRALELFEPRWIMNPSRFESEFSWKARESLQATLRRAWVASATYAKSCVS